MISHNSGALPNSRICLIMAPYFVPWAPPLGITSLKAHLEKEGAFVRLIDEPLYRESFRGTVATLHESIFRWISPRR
jgi:hypothetical protein